MVWTHKFPKQTGWYWYRDKGEDPLVLLVGWIDDELHVTLGDPHAKHGVYPITDYAGEWSNVPLTEPD